jgi:hypothetical protein
MGQAQLNTKLTKNNTKQNVSKQNDTIQHEMLKVNKFGHNCPWHCQQYDYNDNRTL